MKYIVDYIVEPITYNKASFTAHKECPTEKAAKRFITQMKDIGKYRRTAKYSNFKIRITE